MSIGVTKYWVFLEDAVRWRRFVDDGCFRHRGTAVSWLKREIEREREKTLGEVAAPQFYWIKIGKQQNRESEGKGKWEGTKTGRDGCSLFFSTYRWLHDRWTRWTRWTQWEKQRQDQRWLSINYQSKPSSQPLLIETGLLFSQGMGGIRSSAISGMIILIWPNQPTVCLFSSLPLSVSLEGKGVGASTWKEVSLTLPIQRQNHIVKPTLNGYVSEGSDAIFLSILDEDEDDVQLVHYSVRLCLSACQFYFEF